MPQYDFGNMCEMFCSVIKGILIANQDNRSDKVTEICIGAQKSIERLQKREILRESLSDDHKL